MSCSRFKFSVPSFLVGDHGLSHPIVALELAQESLILVSLGLGSGAGGPSRVLSHSSRFRTRLIVRPPRTCPICEIFSSCSTFATACSSSSSVRGGRAGPVVDVKRISELLPEILQQALHQHGLVRVPCLVAVHACASGISWISPELVLQQGTFGDLFQGLRVAAALRSRDSGARPRGAWRSQRLRCPHPASSMSQRRSSAAPIRVLGPWSRIRCRTCGTCALSSVRGRNRGVELVSRHGGPRRLRGDLQRPRENRVRAGTPSAPPHLDPPRPETRPGG